MYSFDCLQEKCIRTPGGILTKIDKGYALLCLGGEASVDCWEINDATAKPHKLTPTLKQNQSQCVRRPHRPKPSVQTMKGQVVIRPSLVLNIIMRHCGLVGTAAAAFRCLLSSFEGSSMMSYFSAAWHSMTHSTPQMVLTMIQLVALSVAGQHVQANETSYTHWNLVSRDEKSAATNTGHFFFSLHGLLLRSVTLAI